ncbi:MAG: cytochrome c peroxidase, partial [Chitinophagaceae bacterium]
MQFVKLRKAYLFLLFFILITSFTVHFSTPEKTSAEKIKDIYVTTLSALQKKINLLKEDCIANKKVNHLQEGFYECRELYKQISFLIEYFNPYETRLLNGPALQRTEDDNPQTIIAPQGFQVLEEILFQPWTKESYPDATNQLTKISEVLQKLKVEPDFQYKFHDEPIFGSFSKGLIRIATMDITGFDSPVAFNSLQEVLATLDGISLCLNQYESVFNKKAPELFTNTIEQIKQAKNYIATNHSFENFDRLHFLKNYFNPLFSDLTTLRDKSGISYSDGLLPVNQLAKSIFDTNFFNVDFFSPNERYRMTPERIELGRKLFFDPILSGNKKRSCASCHFPEKAFTDGLPTSISIDEVSLLTRNSPTLINSVFQTKQFYDSRTSTLENQLSDVVHNSNEMKGSLENTIPELKNDNYYRTQFEKAYKNESDPIIKYNIANAISSYIRSLIYFNSPFDEYMRGDDSKMTAAEKRGFNLFAGKAKCATCHYIHLFNGLVPPDFTETESEVLGVPASNSKKHSKLDDDLGKYNFTKSIVHKHAFKTPTLRNIELTAPYM